VNKQGLVRGRGSPTKWNRNENTERRDNYDVSGLESWCTGRWLRGSELTTARQKPRKLKRAELDEGSRVRVRAT